MAPRWCMGDWLKINYSTYVHCHPVQLCGSLMCSILLSFWITMRVCSTEEWTTSGFGFKGYNSKKIIVGFGLSGNKMTIRQLSITNLNILFTLLDTSAPHGFAHCRALLSSLLSVQIFFHIHHRTQLHSGMLATITFWLRDNENKHRTIHTAHAYVSQPLMCRCWRAICYRENPVRAVL